VYEVFHLSDQKKKLPRHYASEDFIDWIDKTEQVFYYENMVENRKVKLVAIKLRKACFDLVGKSKVSKNS